jgi:phenylalanine-4-hydroxylase
MNAAATAAAEPGGQSPLHGLAGGVVPERPDWTIDQGWERYTPEEHALWRRLFERQTRMLPSRACDDFVKGMRALPIGPERIPDFRRLNEVLMGRTGWQVVAVPGLVPDEVFFEHLANRRFPAGNFLRRPEQIDYLSEPDVFHDVFGHVPMLMHPALADYMQAYGHGGLRAQRLGVLPNLSRVYWFTVEFGLIEEHGALRLYGSGIASSYQESVFCLEDASPNRIRFETERVMRTRYRIDDFQETYFVIRDLDELLELARVDFLPLYERIRGLPDFKPGEVQPGDLVLHRGTGRYHAQRRAG